jgi:hypothetical protein
VFFEIFEISNTLPILSLYPLIFLFLKKKKKKKKKKKQNKEKATGIGDTRVSKTHPGPRSPGSLNEKSPITVQTIMIEFSGKKSRSGFFPHTKIKTLLVYFFAWKKAASVKTRWPRCRLN